MYAGMGEEEGGVKESVRKRRSEYILSVSSKHWANRCTLRLLAWKKHVYSILAIKQNARKKRKNLKPHPSMGLQSMEPCHCILYITIDLTYICEITGPNVSMLLCHVT